MPNSGATSVPKYCSEPNSVRSRTEPVSARMYQPRISVSISLPQEVSMSAGYWKRKLRMRNGASSEDDAIALSVRRGTWPVGPFVAFLDGLTGQAGARLT